MSGKVYLVGAGPGDPGLLTVKARELIERATVIVYDRLADERILSGKTPQAKLIYVGKESNRHTMPQEEINKLLVELAEAGETVVRLKGGDPFVFGRGGEEALALAEAGLPFEIVPGISSAVAVPAYAGIPVTHRGMAASFAVITGHEDPNKETSSLDWDKLAKGADTLIFLMGAATLPQISANLIAAGRSADTPAALIRWGTRPEQETVVTTLGAVAQIEAKSPLIFLVGEVARLREKLSWFDDKKTRPLWGQTILTTRARKQASALTEKLTELGAKVIEAPTIEIAPPADNYRALDEAIDRLGEYKWIIFTSVNGVEHFFSRLRAKSLDSRALYGTKIAVIGKSTADELGKYGLEADLTPPKFYAENLAEQLIPLIKPGDKILLARAAEARDILPRRLEENGASVTVAAAYQTIAAFDNAPSVKKMLTEGEIDWITFTSSSTVRYLLEKISVAEAKRAKIACIGPITAETCRKNGLEPTAVADEYTIDGLVAAIVETKGA